MEGNDKSLVDIEKVTKMNDEILRVDHLSKTFDLNVHCRLEIELYKIHISDTIKVESRKTLVKVLDYSIADYSIQQI